MLCESKAKAAPAVPELRAALLERNSDERVRELAARTLSELGPKASKAAPELEKALNNPSEIVVECAARALGSIGSGAQHALPKLEAKLGQRRDYLGVAIGEAIWRIDPSRSNAVEQVLLECIRDANYYSQIYGCQALWNMTKETEATLPVLESLLADPNAVSMHVWSIRLLAEMGTNAQSAIPILEEKTHLDGIFSATIQKAATDALHQIKPVPIN